MKYVDATVVAVMMPFSSIITGILSVLIGMDTLNTSLVIGAVLGFIAMIICAFGNMQSDKKAKKIASDGEVDEAFFSLEK